ncbi:MAG: glycoside hydrolase family 5 protein [Treponema sp.]|uniref:glycoside hydrolase family 5 protein n=1 Tax=Treponema sp. TaxID=166 RepID=UPI00298DF5D2|nr:glycoside hydrolase family 5 protein [Treponema sp.]MCR5387159.1 glycoside hydrolase family 5 protein [Treponema sp.]
MKIFLSRLNFQLKKLTGTFLKVLALSILFAALCTGCASPGGSGGGDSILVIPGEDTPIDGLSSVDFASAMCVGWNLGNTFDSAEYGNKNNKGNNYETAWGMPKTTKAMINRIAAKGFKTIRIPVSWHNHITSETNLTIDPAWLSRVKEVVDWAREYKMFVIINIHHDNLTSEQMSSTYGFSVNTDTDQQNASKNYIQKIWTQVANYFKDYDNHLIFELLNEPRNIDGPNAGFGDQPNLSTLNGIISQYNQTALNAIRATGGNNENRFVMAPYYAASPWKSSGWTIPSDNNASDKILISVHAYDPYEFAMGTMSDTTFAENEEGSQLGYLFDELKTKWVNHGRGVVMGEASCTDKNNLSDRLAWFNSYIPKAKAINCPVILWDNMQTATTSPADKDVPERHGYLNRNTLTWIFPTLVNAMISKAGGVVDCYSTEGENGNENGGENSSGTPIVVWTGSQDLGHWKGDNAITLASSLFASATDSSYLRLTISKGAECNALVSGNPCSNNYSSIHPITDWDNGNITFTTDTANATVNSDKQLEVTNIIPANGTTTVNISPDSTSWNAIKSNGLIIYGHKVTITNIELM